MSIIIASEFITTEMGIAFASMLTVVARIIPKRTVLKTRVRKIMFEEICVPGELSEYIEEKLQMYFICAMQYKLSRTQKAEFFIHVLSGPTRRIFLDHCFYRDFRSLYDMARIMAEEHGSDARWMQVKGTLETLFLRKFMAKTDISDVLTVPKKLVEHINVLAAQHPRDFSLDIRKIDYLRKAVTEFTEWSQIPVESITARRYTFTKFVHSLHESNQRLCHIQWINGRSSALDPFFISKYPIVTAYTVRAKATICVTSDVEIVRDARTHPRTQKLNFTVKRNSGSTCKRNLNKSKRTWQPGYSWSKSDMIKNYRPRISSGEKQYYVLIDFINDFINDDQDVVLKKKTQLLSKTTRSRKKIQTLPLFWKSLILTSQFLLLQWFPLPKTIAMSVFYMKCRFFYRF